MRGPYDSGRFANVPDAHLDRISSPEDVARVVQQMLVDLQEHPDEWENYTLESFLDALGRYLEALPQLYANRGEQFPTQPTWAMFGEVFVGVTGYE